MTGEAVRTRRMPPIWAVDAAIALGAWLTGLVVRRQLQARQEHIAALAERAELIAAQQQEHERRATLAERLRIARELHDIVAHHLSVVVIQAQAAQRVAAARPARAIEAMADVERTGRTAFEEMRRLPGLLRPDQAGEPGEQSGPPLGLADLDDLAALMAGGGLPVSVLRHGEPDRVPEDVGLTVYRIVQEALTNVLKHAGRATAIVDLTITSRRLDVMVLDDGHGAGARDRRAGAGRPRPVQRGDRPSADGHRDHAEDARAPPADQASRPRPRPLVIFAYESGLTRNP
jgi:signal transduction histidine kinase